MIAKNISRHNKILLNVEKEIRKTLNSVLKKKNLKFIDEKFIFNKINELIMLKSHLKL